MLIPLTKIPKYLQAVHFRLCEGKVKKGLLLLILVSDDPDIMGGNFLGAKKARHGHWSVSGESESHVVM